jgi:hypothetical protein
LSGTEPATPEVGPYTNNTKTDPADLGMVTYRQGSTTAAPTLTIDGVRIGTSWNDGAVPVELASFTSVIKDNDITLKWQTITELNNKGFEVYRNSEMIKFVPGFGTSSEKKSYQYLDKNLNNGTYTYSLVQVDLNGTKKTIGTTEAIVSSVPKEFSLSQNYPNPFNPSTIINFALPSDAKVNLKVYNVLGVEVANLIDNNLSAGLHQAKFNASSFNSGIYFYTLSAKGIDGSTFSNTMKMLLVK